MLQTAATRSIATLILLSLTTPLNKLLLLTGSTRLQVTMTYMYTKTVCVYSNTVRAHAIAVEIYLSVRLSVKRVTKRNNLLPTFLYHMKGWFIWFYDTENDIWGTPPSTWNFGPNWPRRWKTAISNFARRASAVTPSVKRFNYHWQELRIPLRDFLCTYDEHHALLLNPSKGVQNSKPQNGRIASKILLFSKKVWYKILGALTMQDEKMQY